MSALEQARLVRSGEVSSPELVEASVRRAEEVQERLNCFVSIDGDRALAAAESVEPGDPRPFAGVPTAVKDIAPSADHTLTLGSEHIRDFSPAFHAHAIRRLREAGLVVIGQTTTPEMGIVNVTEGRRYGPTRNPWDPGRTPGGSSGGAAAAVAGGAVSLAHGSDGGGSIRIPAACCGLVGLKPRRGRVSACRPARGRTPPRRSTRWPATSPATPTGLRLPTSRSSMPHGASPAGSGWA